MTLVHFTGEHSLEFKLLDPGLHLVEFFCDRLHDIRFFLLDRQLQHFLCVGKPGREFVECIYNVFQIGSFPAQGLCFFRITPDIRVFQLPAYLFQTITLFSVVKDTP